MYFSLLLISALAVFSKETDYKLNIQNNIDNGCPWDWQYFDRPSGGWCMKVFLGSMLQNEAEKMCQLQNATLSGIQKPSEVTFINFASEVQMSAQSGSVWIGAKRTADCMKSKRNQKCSNLTSFEWTDGSATGTDGFVFQANQPDNSGSQQGIYSDCAVLFVNKPQYSGNESIYIGHLDDVPCTPPSYTFDSERLLQGYVCGKKAN